MTSVEEMPAEVRDLYPPEIRRLYEIHEWRNGTVVLALLHPNEWGELLSVLAAFWLKRSHIARGGGNKSAIARDLDERLLASTPTSPTSSTGSSRVAARGRTSSSLGGTRGRAGTPGATRSRRIPTSC